MKTPEPVTTIVIVGSGPAGTAAAIQCAGQGFSVTMLEKSPHTVFHPGETLPPGVEILFQQLGIADEVNACDFIRHEGSRVKWDTETTLFSAFGRDPVNGNWKGYQIPRERLNAILHARAKAMGVKIVKGTRAVSPLYMGGNIVGVMTREGEIPAEFIIDASGRHGWLSRMPGFIKKPSSPRLIARYGYAAGSDTGRDNAPHFTAERCGWSWVAKISDGLYAWTQLSFYHPREIPGSPPSLVGMEPFGPTGSADVSWRITTPLCGERYYIIGDAASIVDPAGSKGVLKALMSGMMAASSIAAEIHNPGEELRIRRGYTDWVEQWFNQDVIALREFYRCHPCPPVWLDGC
ncbi:NAD(P)/FAD-dependent oxidoreductase [Enterobacter cloacae]|uniref:NAD(P)/FAD-dependent oxidoreductase n=1 Tax=Enterobacter cloacae TaxID=550 RepID=UPI002004F4D3|nr:NAD(P)/FAD-dependent oxidoreductase [Enterobacter cloacae]